MQNPYFEIKTPFGFESFEPGDEYELPTPPRPEYTLAELQDMGDACRGCGLVYTERHRILLAHDAIVCGCEAAAEAEYYAELDGGAEALADERVDQVRHWTLEDHEAEPF